MESQPTPTPPLAAEQWDLIEQLYREEVEFYRSAVENILSQEGPPMETNAVVRVVRDLTRYAPDDMRRLRVLEHNQQLYPTECAVMKFKALVTIEDQRLHTILAAIFTQSEQ